MNDHATARPADAIPDGWVDRLHPEFLRPWARLMRLDRPVGVWLLLWPCWWSVMLAGASQDMDPWNGAVLGPMLAFAAGAVIMRAAGCIINDLWDRDIDSLVERTAGRPIASGAISIGNAFLFMVVLAMLGLAILLWFNHWTVIVGLMSVPLIILYPLAKRFTYWPQVVLGIVFNWGALLGWCAVMNEPPALPALVLYGACFFWTLAYDTIYAHMDRDDDVTAGVKSSALALGRFTKPFLRLMFALVLVFLAAAGGLIQIGPLFYVGLLATAWHFAWQLSRLDIDDPAVCLRLFRSNVDLGWIVLASLVAGYLFR